MADLSCKWCISFLIETSLAWYCLAFSIWRNAHRGKLMLESECLTGYSWLKELTKLTVTMTSVIAWHSANLAFSCWTLSIKTRWFSLKEKFSYNHNDLQTATELSRKQSWWPVIQEQISVQHLLLWKTDFICILIFNYRNLGVSVL